MNHVYQESENKNMKAETKEKLKTTIENNQSKVFKITIKNTPFILISKEDMTYDLYTAISSHNKWYPDKIICIDRYIEDIVDTILENIQIKEQEIER